MKSIYSYCQWRANPNPNLDLNPDLATFAKSGGFGLDLNFFGAVDLDLDLSFFRRAGFGFELFLEGWIPGHGSPIQKWSTR